MPPLETIRALAAFERRGPGTDAERRAGRWLAGELIAQRHRVRVETFWCRPNWALAHAWHVALAVLGSLLSPSQPIVGVILLAIALGSIVIDDVTGISLGRRLTPERASQNVVATVRGSTDDATDRFRLIIAANYAAGRTAFADRNGLRRAAARLRRLAGPAQLGWLAWVSIAIVWLLVIAIIRLTVNHPPAALGAIQLPPTVGLVLALALLLEAAAAPYGPAANDNASGVGLALAAAGALAARTPESLVTELVLTGAGEAGGIGLRHHLKAHRQALKGVSTIVLGIAPCGIGQPYFWRSDGRLFPLGYARPLRELASGLPAAQPHRGRGLSPALVARARGLPALAIGCLDRHGLAPRSHQPGDLPDAIDEVALEQALECALQLVDEIDASLTKAPLAKAPPLGAADQSH